ncbi:GSCOCT00014312001.2-RA-CDS [Cotesia congregata]|uniref:Cc_ptp.epsilon_26.7_pseudo n=1 Tax=Cotesia congregata TaxID=51543 RepID=A0A8J2HGR6_COTCN|nr:GSCOCT00014312001.2-RA-CDS [Cotesia congregata]CAG5094018.1 cc_ptp.epsilon_26.7_pseudo [Cotesia congregata]
MELPASPEDFINFVLAVRHNQKEIQVRLTQEGCKYCSPPIIVHSTMGVERSAAFCAIETEISRYNKLGVIYFLSIHSGPNSGTKTQFSLSNFDYYLFCYRVLAKYVNLFRSAKDNNLQKPTTSHVVSLIKNFSVSKFFNFKDN